MMTGATTRQPAYQWQTPQPVWASTALRTFPAPVATWPNPATHWQQQTSQQPMQQSAQPWQATVLATQLNQPQQVPVQQTMPATTMATQQAQNTPTAPQQPQLQGPQQLPNYVPPLLPSVVVAFQQTDMPGKPSDIIISTHVTPDHQE